MKYLKKGLYILFASAIFAVTILMGDVCTKSRVQQLLDNMTLRQKITQMFEVDIRAWGVDENKTPIDFTQMNESVKKIIKDYDFGAVIYFSGNLKETKQSYELTMELQKAAVKDNGIPLIISVDQEGGIVYRLGSGTALPGNMALAATQNIAYAEKSGEIIGSELSALGINTNLAPVVDVNNNANNPVIGLRSFSDDADIVGQMASATIRGLAKYNVIGCAKHFPGHGDVDTDSHYDLPCVDKSKEELLNNELKPYRIVIDHGIEMIMTAHILYPQLDDGTIYSEKTGKQEKIPATMSEAIITDLLKKEMGFNGIVTTDSMYMKGISNNFDEIQATKQAIKAGADLICMPYKLYMPEDLKKIDEIIDGMEKAVNSGEIPESRLNDAVTRILSVKENRGILDWNEADYSLAKCEAVVGSEENRAAEREIAAKAVTVVKNENNVLPLDITNSTRVLALTPYEKERSQMVMGWNRAKNAGLIADGARMEVHCYTEDTTAENTKELLDWADVYIIISEIYNASLSKAGWFADVPEALVDYGKENNKITVIMSTNKPYDVQLYENADAIMAVYGDRDSLVDITEAFAGETTARSAYGPNIIAGIEVALGTFGASGVLPVNIPELDFENNTYNSNIIYKRGYGIHYPAKEPFVIENQSGS